MVVELMDGAGQRIPLPVGETVLGRGDLHGNSDKRLSRKQVCNCEVVGLMRVSSST